MEVRWSIPAAEDLEHICVCPDHLRRVRAPEGFSQSWTGQPAYAWTSRTHIRTPSYIVDYQVKPAAIEISRIFHGAQDWPYGASWNASADDWVRRFAPPKARSPYRRPLSQSPGEG